MGHFFPLVLFSNHKNSNLVLCMFVRYVDMLIGLICKTYDLAPRTPQEVIRFKLMIGIFFYLSLFPFHVLLMNIFLCFLIECSINVKRE